MPHACDWKLVHASDYITVEWCRQCGALKIEGTGTVGIERPALILEDAYQRGRDDEAELSDPRYDINQER